MKTKILSQEPTRTFAIIFDPGEEVASRLLEFARENQVASASFTAIGAFSEVTLGYFELSKKDYKRIPIREQVEVLSLLGNIAVHDNQPKLHAHVVVGKSDGTAHGGHLMEARVQPTLEIVLTEAAENMVRRVDELTGLPLLTAA